MEMAFTEQLDEVAPAHARHISGLLDVSPPVLHVRMEQVCGQSDPLSIIWDGQCLQYLLRVEKPILCINSHFLAIVRWGLLFREVCQELHVSGLTHSGGCVCQIIPRLSVGSWLMWHLSLWLCCWCWLHRNRRRDHRLTKSSKCLPHDRLSGLHRGQHSLLNDLGHIKAHALLCSSSWCLTHRLGLWRGRSRRTQRTRNCWLWLKCPGITRRRRW